MRMHGVVQTPERTLAVSTGSLALRGHSLRTCLYPQPERKLEWSTGWLLAAVPPGAEASSSFGGSSGARHATLSCWPLLPQMTS